MSTSRMSNSFQVFNICDDHKVGRQEDSVLCEQLGRSTKTCRQTDRLATVMLQYTHSTCITEEHTHGEVFDRENV